MDCNDSCTQHIRRSTLRSASSFFSSSATLRHRTSSASLIKEIRNRSLAIETTKTNNTREPRARASDKHFATVHLRDIALTPRTVFTVSIYSIITRNRFLNSSRAHSAFPGERSKYALDVRRNASRDRNCGRFLLRHDFYISIHKYYTAITVRGTVQLIYHDIKQEIIARIHCETLTLNDYLGNYSPRNLI